MIKDSLFFLTSLPQKKIKLYLPKNSFSPNRQYLYVSPALLFLSFPKKDILSSTLLLVSMLSKKQKTLLSCVSLRNSLGYPKLFRYSSLLLYPFIKCCILVRTAGMLHIPRTLSFLRSLVFSWSLNPSLLSNCRHTMYLFLPRAA